MFYAILLGLILHNLSQRSRIAHIQGAHKGKVSGLCFAGEDRFLSCGVDRNIKMWGASGDSDSGGTSVNDPNYYFINLCV